MKRRHLIASLLSLAAAALLASGCGDNKTAGGTASPGATNAPDAGGKLTIAWAKWKPADQLQELSKAFTKETGIPVEVQQIPWSDFETKINAAWTAKDTSYDLIVGDSQWLGKAATSGHYIDLTDWINDPANFPKADNEEAAVKNYGEYEGKLYAVPCMADGIAFAYRKDLFDDSKNKQAFKAKYGKELAPPDTWDDFKNVAEFFTRDGLYGCALFYSKEYDGVTMGFDQVLWAFGGKLAEGKKVEGVINSPEAVKALEFYASLKKFTPPGSETSYFAENLTAFQEGKVAMSMNWFAFFPDLVDAAKNKFADKTGYFPMPKGPGGRFVSLGGQGLSVSAYSKNQENAKKFIAWFSKEETQKEWVKLGGLTANKKVAATDEFKKANPYNEVFAQSAAHLQDFANSPDYSERLKISQDNLSAAITGSKSAKDALDTIAKEQQALSGQ